MKHLRKYIHSAGFLIIGIALSIGLSAFATPPGNKYGPGETSNPTCAPGSSNCSVNLGWEVNTTDGFVFNDTDLVGIGTDTPTATLDVAGEFQVATELPSTAIAIFKQGDLSGFGGGEGFQWYTLDSFTPTQIGSISLNFNGGSPQYGVSVDNGTTNASFSLIASGSSQLRTVLPGGLNIDRYQGDLSGIGDDYGFQELLDDGTSSAVVGVAYNYNIGTSTGEPKYRTYVSNGVDSGEFYLDSATGNGRIQVSNAFDLIAGLSGLSFENDGTVSLVSSVGTQDTTVFMNNTGLFVHASDDINPNYGNIAAKTDQAMLAFYDENQHTNGLVGVAENGGNTMSIMQTNNQNTDMSFGFTAFPDSATMFRCNETTPTAAPCDDDRGIYINNGSVFAYLWNADSIDNNNKNTNGWDINDSWVRLYYEQTSGTPSAPGANTSLTLADNLTLTNAKFGIGNPSPAYMLDVQTDAASSYVATFFNDGNNQNRYGIQVQAGADDGTGTTYYFNALDGDGTQVGYISRTAGTFALTDISDERTKTNITDTDIDGLDIINDLEVKDFNRKEDPSGKTITGFIAQEVQNIYPEAITKGQNGYLGIMKDALVPVLVKAVQELSSMLASLHSDLIAWFADTENMIGDFVATRGLFKQEICVDGECLNKQDIHALLQLVASQDDAGSSVPSMDTNDEGNTTDQSPEEVPSDTGDSEDEIIEDAGSATLEDPMPEEGTPSDMPDENANVPADEVVV